MPKETLTYMFEGFYRTRTGLRTGHASMMTDDTPFLLWVVVWAQLRTPVEVISEDMIRDC